MVNQSFFKTRIMKVKKLKPRNLSIVLVLCLCVSSQPVSYASQEVPSLQEEESTNVIKEVSDESENSAESNADETAELDDSLVKEEEGTDSSDDVSDEEESNADENTGEADDSWDV